MEAATGNASLVETIGKGIVMDILATENTYRTVQGCLDLHEASVLRVMPIKA